MSTEMKTGTGSAEEHIREAERFAASAELWMDPDSALNGLLDERERLLRRSVDLQAAQVHATLAQTLKAAELMPMMASMAAAIAPGAPVEPEGPAPAGKEERQP